MKVKLTKSVMINGEAVREGEIIDVSDDVLTELRLANCIELVNENVVVVIDADENNVTDKVVENKIDKKRQKDNK